MIVHRQENFFKVELVKTKVDLEEQVEFCIEREGTSGGWSSIIKDPGAGMGLEWSKAAA